MATQLRFITADELLAMPNDGIRRELVNGEIREMSPAGERHGDAAQNINRSLDAHVHLRQLGRVRFEVGHVLESDPDTVRAPDVAFVRADRLSAPGASPGFFRGAPDLAVEVVSPYDRYGEVRTKVREYIAAGTRMVLVVDPENRTVTVHRSGLDVVELAEADVIDGDDVVPGWRLPVRDIFA
ncbi:MAG TPA: Uma2 family endonuclease [Longimicrobium sp.]|jgi:Uma2 family endonuclease|uniref:Uma2 family endonuclease n=1 Tax=Longimicrobium sp. TaxID=2029185 RepID=UPI002ED99CF0